MKDPLKIVVKITDCFGNVSYLKVRESGAHSLIGRDCTPLSLANITDNAAELSIALDVAATGNEVMEAVDKYCRRRVTSELYYFA
jgi:hypothetical protein